MSFLVDMSVDQVTSDTLIVIIKIIWTKRQREMIYGEAGSLLKYFQDKSVENPSFQYAIQMDCE